MDERAALEAWTTAVADALGEEPLADLDGMLDLVRVVAHRVQRPAGPLSAYLIGVAVGAGARSLEDAQRQVLNLVDAQGAAPR